MISSFNELIEKKSTEYSGNLFLDGLYTVSFSEMQERTKKTAGIFQRLGLTEGKRISFISHTNEDCILMSLSALRCGAIISMLPEEVTPLSVLSMVDTVDAEFLCVRQNEAADFEFITEESALCRTLIVYDEQGNILNHPSEPEQDEIKLPVMKAEDPCFMLLTSGTTSSKAKAIQYSNKGLIETGEIIAKSLSMNQDILCTFLPLCHCFGLINNVFAALWSGSCLVIPQSKRKVDILNSVQEKHCTILNAVPSVFQKIVEYDELEEYDVSSIRIGVVAGAYCPKDLFIAIQQKLDMNLLTGLGLTETLGPITQTDANDSLEIKCRTVGKFMTNIEHKIDMIGSDPNEGEICVRGESVIKHYYNDPEASRLVIDEDGWFHTGDIAKVDENGYVKIVGRKKNLIIRDGENISPIEIDEKACSIEGISECATVGIPDRHYGEEICLCFIPKENANLNEEAIEKSLSAILEKCKVPRYYLRYDSFPKTASGKIATLKLREDAIKRIKDNTENQNI